MNELLERIRLLREALSDIRSTYEPDPWAPLGTVRDGSRAWDTANDALIDDDKRAQVVGGSPARASIDESEAST